MERRYHLAQRALVETKPRSKAGWSTTGRRGVGRGGAGRPRLGRAGVEHSATGAAPLGPGGVVQGEAGAAVRGALDGGGAHGSDAREREAGERKGSAGYYTAYVRRADTSVNKHKQTGLHGGRGALYSSATR
jgi:hypothetical protein